jgi:hypothetical protein
MGRKQAFHYVARVKGDKPTRFFHEMGRGPISNSAAGAFSGWARADVVLYPTGSPGEYEAKWFDRFSDTFRETPLTVLEEVSASSRGVSPSLPPGTKRG